ncbi:hypothetical protein C8R45DRAFT_1099241 [Mycena sanguinolenta]|nr:hypothetical protein C8R45DRAFT_1099241 [Mycena sanguinolenta]
MESLPQELIDAIVELVSDKSLLPACALVESAFVDATRPIFHSISIKDLPAYNVELEVATKTMLNTFLQYPVISASGYLHSILYAPPSTTAALRHCEICSSQLEILEIEFSHAFDLPLLTALRHLELLIHSDMSMIAELVPWFVSCSLQTTPCLKQLTVAIYEWGVFTRHRAAQWGVLDEQLLVIHAHGHASGDEKREDG